MKPEEDDCWFEQFRVGLTEYLEQNHTAASRAWKYADEWTKVISAAANHAASNLGKRLMCKGFRDDEQRCEYLSIDAAVLGDSYWAAPWLMIEFENRPNRAAYSAWKLLCTRAERRLLIGYYSDGQGETVNSVRRRLAEVVEAHPGVELYALAAPYSHAASRGDWFDHFKPLEFGSADLPGPSDEQEVDTEIRAFLNSLEESDKW